MGYDTEDNFPFVLEPNVIHLVPKRRWEAFHVKQQKYFSQSYCIEIERKRKYNIRVWCSIGGNKTIIKTSIVSELAKLRASKLLVALDGAIVLANFFFIVSYAYFLKNIKCNFERKIYIYLCILDEELCSIEQKPSRYICWKQTLEFLLDRFWHISKTRKNLSFLKLGFRQRIRIAHEN